MNQTLIPQLEGEVPGAGQATDTLGHPPHHQDVTASNVTMNSST